MGNQALFCRSNRAGGSWGVEPPSSRSGFYMARTRSVSVTNTSTLRPAIARPWPCHRRTSVSFAFSASNSLSRFSSSTEAPAYFEGHWKYVPC